MQGASALAGAGGRFGAGPLEKPLDAQQLGEHPRRRLAEEVEQRQVDNGEVEPPWARARSTNHWPMDAPTRPRRVEPITTVSFGRTCMGLLLSEVGNREDR